MKKFTRMMALALACMMMLALVACGNDTPTTTGKNPTPSTNAPSNTSSSTTAPTEPELSYEEKVFAFMSEMENASAPGLNTYESGWDEIVAHLTEKGVIASDATQTDMLTTAGYLKKYDGTFEETYAFADKAVDFGGVYLVWWDLVNTTSAYDCYTAMANNPGYILVGGGMYSVNATFESSGSYAIGFAEGYDENAAENAKSVLKAIDSTAYSLKYMSGTTDLAMAMMKQGLLAATDIASGVDMNANYAYTCQRRDWVGYDESPETGYSEPYETTDNAYVATKGYDFGKLTILYYAPADVSENSYYSYLVSIWNQIQEKGTITPYCRLTTGWDYTPYTVDAEGNFSADGTALEIPVTAVFGQFVIIINE